MSCLVFKIKRALKGANGGVGSCKACLAPRTDVTRTDVTGTDVTVTRTDVTRTDVTRADVTRTDQVGY